jgi:choline-glycine betaine transporter
MKNILKLLLSGALVYFVFFYLYKFLLNVIFGSSINEGNFIPAIIFIALIVIIFIIFYKSFSFIIDGINLKIAKKVISGFLIIICVIIFLFILKSKIFNPYNNCGVAGCEQTPIYPCIPSSENNNCE